jgi:hypothetical protein
MMAEYFKRKEVEGRSGVDEIRLRRPRRHV